MIKCKIGLSKKEICHFVTFFRGLHLAAKSVHHSSSSIPACVVLLLLQSPHECILSLQSIFHDFGVIRHHQSEMKCSSEPTAGSNPNPKRIQPKRIAADQRQYDLIIICVMHLKAHDNLDDNWERLDENDVDITQNLTIPKSPQKRVNVRDFQVIDSLINLTIQT